MRVREAAAVAALSMLGAVGPADAQPAPKISVDPALAVQDIAREKGKIVALSGPGAMRLTNEVCSPYSVHWTYKRLVSIISAEEAFLPLARSECALVKL